jgi:hypothetical protein
MRFIHFHMSGMIDMVPAMWWNCAGFCGIGKVDLDPIRFGPIRCWPCSQNYKEKAKIPKRDRLILATSHFIGRG